VGGEAALSHLGHTGSLSRNGGKKRQAFTVVPVGRGSNSKINNCKNNPTGDDLSFERPTSPFQKKCHLINASGSVEISPTVRESNTCGELWTLPLVPLLSESQPLPIGLLNSGEMLDASLQS
jgi:hypothetical protein